ncbi:MAG: DUF2256 domain-containing protein [Cohaesibacteraceae bacterium]
MPVESESELQESAPLKSVKKTNLPTKTCPICQRPFTWRRKWKLNWEKVVYCSQRCRSEARRRS